MDISSENYETISEEEFEAVVERWMLYQLTDQREREQLSKLMEKMMDYDRSDLFKLFIRNMETVNISGTQYPYICRILLAELSDDAIFFISQSIEISFYTVLLGFINGADEEILPTGLKNIDILFSRPRIDITAIEELLKRAEAVNKATVMEYLDDLLSERKREVSAAKVPYWMIYPDDGILVSHEELIARLPTKEVMRGGTLEERVERICQHIANVNKMIDIEDVRESLMMIEGEGEEDGEAAREQRIRYLETNFELDKLEWEPELFRTLGACLQIPKGGALAMESDDPCQLYGGCRVMLCYHGENWDSEVERKKFDNPVAEGALEELDWFQGRCVVCHLTILKKCYALRMPLVGGSWRDCYCSFECLKKDVDEFDDTTHQMINRLEGVYDLYKIYDRLE